MKTIMKLSVILLAMIVSRCAVADDATSNIVCSIKVLVNNCISALPGGMRGTPSYMMEFGMPDGARPFEQTLGMSISNSLSVAYSNFTTIAQSRLEKAVFLASAWNMGDDYYLECLSRNVDLALAGEIDRDDLCWYMRGHRTRRLSYILAAQYDRPGVSNIVYKLIAFTGETNKYEKVLSGEAKTEYLEFEQFMADGPEAPRVVDP